MLHFSNLFINVLFSFKWLFGIFKRSHLPSPTFKNIKRLSAKDGAFLVQCDHLGKWFIPIFGYLLQ